MRSSLLLLLILSAIAVECDKVRLFGPRVTDWGHWHDWKHCPEGSYVAAIKHKIEGDQRGGDDTGLNAIALFCYWPNWEHDGGAIELKSGEGPFGGWGAYRRCPPGQFVIGFQMRSEPDQRGGDDVAADNVAVQCNNPYAPRSEHSTLTGDSPGWGDWTAVQWCPSGYAVCGVATQIEGDQRGGDDTALNNVDMDCCKVNIDCEPKFEMTVIDEYDNRRGTGNVNYTYTRQVSITNTRSTTTTVSHEEKRIIAEKISHSLGFSGNGMSSTIAHELGVSDERTATQTLQSMVMNSAQTTETKSFSTPVPVGKQLTVKQVNFRCGQYLVRVPKTVLLST